LQPSFSFSSEHNDTSRVLPALGDFVTDKPSLLRQAAMLLKLSKSAADPALAASLVQRAADLQAQAEAMGDDAPSENKTELDQ